MKSGGRELSQEFGTGLIQGKLGAKADTGYLPSHSGGTGKLESCYLPSSVTQR